MVVAIPAKDEADRINPCLLALARQSRPPDAVVLLLNNCTDGSAEVAVGLSAVLPYRLSITSNVFPPDLANAGHARCVAMAQAAEQAGSNGILLTTDADTVVADDWVERNLLALAAGAEVVCGRIELDPAEAAMIPPHLHADDALECELTRLLDETACIVDPEPADPWPRHTEAAGASLAVTVDAYHRAGGMPPIASGEDRAFVALLSRMDARIRHDPLVRVTVSGRIEGRTPGGMADTIRRRIEQQDAFTDATLEPAADAYRRVDFRRRVRLAWRRQLVGRAWDPGLPIDLGIPPDLVSHALRCPFFGTAWGWLQASSPFLVSRRVRFKALPQQIDYARELLQHARFEFPATAADGNAIGIVPQGG